MERRIFAQNKFYKHLPLLHLAEVLYSILREIQNSALLSLLKRIIFPRRMSAQHHIKKISVTILSTIYISSAQFVEVDIKYTNSEDVLFAADGLCPRADSNLKRQPFVRIPAFSGSPI